MITRHNDSCGKKLRLNIFASFMADMLLEKFVTIGGDSVNLLEMKLLPYHQILQLLLDPSKQLHKEQQGIAVVLIRASDYFYNIDLDEDKLKILSDQFISAITKYQLSLSAPLIICFCPDKKNQKNFEQKVYSTFEKSNFVQVILSKDFNEVNFSDKHFDLLADQLAHIPYTQMGFELIAYVIFQNIKDLLTKLAVDQQVTKSHFLSSPSYKEIDDFIDTLKLELTYKKTTKESVAKISHLTQLVSHFNLLNQYWSEAKVKELLDANYTIIQFQAKDCFGDYGTVGFISFYLYQDELIINNIIFICRALGKNIEHKAIKIIADIAKNLKAKIIVVKKINKDLHEDVLNYLKSYLSINDNNQVIVYAVDAFESCHYLHREQIFALPREGSLTTKYFSKQEYHICVKMLQGMLLNYTKSKGELTHKNSFEKDSLTKSANLVEQLSILWESELHIKKISIEDNFFDLGGNSLSMVKILAAINDNYGLNLSVSDFYYNATISDLSKLISRNKLNDRSDDEPLIVEDQSYPLLDSQKSLWLINNIASNCPYVYHVVAHYSLIGEVDIAALNYSFNRLIRENDIFRLSFHLKAGELCQILHSMVDYQFEIKECDFIDADESVCERHLLDDARQPFDLENAPLLRVHLYKLKQNEYKLLIVTHHIIYDDWSWQVANSLLQQYYTEYVTGVRAENKVTKNTAFLSYTKKQINLQTKALETNQWSFWENYWKDILLLNLSSDTDNLVMPNYQGDYFPISFTIEKFVKLKTVAKKLKVSMFSLIFSLWAFSIHIFTGKTDFPMGTVMSGRENFDNSCTLGYFAKTVLSRIKISDHFSFAAFATQTHENLLSVFSNSNVSINKMITDILRPYLGPVFEPIEVMMVFLPFNSSDLNLRLPNINTTLYKRRDNVARFKIILELEEKDDNLIGGIYFRTESFDVKKITRLADILNNSVEQCLMKILTE